MTPEDESPVEHEAASGEKHVLKIEFGNADAMRHFATWLCESGEQGYWAWIEVRETEEEGPITAVSFEYHPVLDPTKSWKDPDRLGEFLADGTIRTVCGRLSE